MLKDATILFIGNSLNAVLAIVFTIVSARFLGPEGFGILTTVISLIIIISTLGDLGLGSSLFRFVSKYYLQGKKKKARDYQSAIFTMRLFILLLILTFLIIFVRHNSYLIFISFGVSSFLLLDFQIQTFQSKKKFISSSIFLVSSNATRIILTGLLIVTNRISLINILISYALAPLIIFFISLKWDTPIINLHTKWKKMSKKIIFFSGWMGIGKIAGTLSGRLDVIFLIKFLGPYQTGIYSAGRQIVQGIPIFVGSFATVIAPHFATLEGQSLKKYFKKSLVISMLLILALFVGVFISPFIIKLFGSKYHDSLNILRILIISFIPFTLSSPAINMIIYSFHKPQIITTLTLLQLFLIFIGNIILIPKFGIYSPAIIIALTDSVNLFVAYSFVFYLFNKNEKN